MKNLDKALQEVKYSYENVPFYREKLNELGIEPSLLKDLEQFKALPYTAKMDFRKNFPKGVLAEGFPLNHPMLTSSRSSGSTGERLITIEIGMYLLQRATACAKINPAVDKAFNKVGRRIARYAAPNCSDVECANPNSALEDRLLSDDTLVLPVYHDLLTTSEALIDRAIEEIATYKPDLFYVDPTHFTFLLREYKKRGLKPPQIPVMCSYTASTMVAKRQIAEFYDLESFYTELLSSTEFGWVAMECPHGILHLNDDSYFFEFIEVDVPLRKDEQFFELCISSIDQGAEPHVRYRTGDIVRKVPGQCGCGTDRTGVVMEGRLTHFLTKDGQPMVAPQEVDGMIGAAEWLDQYQLEQIANEEFVLKLITNDEYQENDEAYIIDALQEALQSKVKINVEIVDYIASERSGKFQIVRGLQ